MNRKVKGWIFVFIQFGLFAGILMMPESNDWVAPTTLRTLAWLNFGLVAVALWQLGKARTASPVPTVDGELVISGLYRRVRHPIYGLLLIAFGLITLASQNWQALALFLGLQILFYMKADFEEKLLREKFPKYVDYERTTGRFFPRILI